MPRLFLFKGFHRILQTALIHACKCQPQDLLALLSHSTPISKKDLRSTLERLEDFYPTKDICIQLHQTLNSQPVDGAFWSKFLLASDELKRPLLARGVLDFVLTTPDSHNIATIMQALRSLVSYKRFEEFHSLFDTLVQRLTDAQKKAFSDELVELLSNTPYWNEALGFLPSCSHPRGTRNLSEGAVQFGSFDDVFRLLDNLNPYNEAPSDRFFRLFFDRLGDINDLKHIDRLFSVLHEKVWVVSDQTAKVITTWFNSRVPSDYQAQMEDVQISGTTCSHCKSKLPVFRIDEENLKQMADEFYQSAFKGTRQEHLYLTTTPKELSTLDKFLNEQTMPFDCIIDIMNVVHLLDAAFVPEKATRLVCEVLRNLNRRFGFHRFCLVGKGARVVGNKTFWSAVKTLGNQLGISVFTFITNQRSDDDIFMLYIALWSGPRCHLVSNDEFKQHRFTVGLDLGMRISQWQATRQIALCQQRRQPFLEPIQCDTRAHGSLSIGWHIPYDDKSQRRSYVPPNHWICIKPQSYNK
ncbi:Mitochondrial ribonuclease P catalytic subunit [Clonorchis sinensis]|uniref:Mitochondrial ribonuclease P catalytic subunit n=1 Tax=Clonorchis sinensis TaxID=79923 RepID=A0A3R7FZM0_CLOSI|nr:Mitochondrial ribonuclease P catalytic subunit [Clonorchis sinensis]